MADAATLSVLLQVRDEATRQLEQVKGKMNNLTASVQKNAQAFRMAGIAFTAAGAALTGLAVLSVKAATSFESSFAGVRKTVDATEQEFAELAAGFRKMAKEIPINVNELNRIGEAAGQLGIKKEAILGFTDTIAKLGVTTNLTGEQAATQLARLANITGLSQTQFDRMGSSLVELGNNLATTEAEILTFSLRIAGAGTIAGLTETQLLAIGGAMTSVGVQAEAGGTAVQKALLGMNQAVINGGKKLEVFAATAGLTADEFAKAWEQDAGNAFTLFVEGLGRAGDDAVNVLAELDLKDQRLVRSFLSLANAGGLLRESMDLSSAAFKANTALTEEAEKRFATFESQLTLAKNQLIDVGITLGQILIPMLRSALEHISPLIESVGAWVQENAGLAKVLIIAAAAVGGLMLVLGPLLIILPQIAAALGLVKVAMLALGTTSAGPIGLVILALGALAAIMAPVLIDNFRGAGKASAEFRGELEQLEKTAKSTGLFFEQNFIKALQPVEKALRELSTSQLEVSLGFLNSQMAELKESLVGIEGTAAFANLTDQIEAVRSKAAELNAELAARVSAPDVAPALRETLEESLTFMEQWAIDTTTLAFNTAKERLEQQVEAGRTQIKEQVAIQDDSLTFMEKWENAKTTLAFNAAKERLDKSVGLELEKSAEIRRIQDKAIIDAQRAADELIAVNERLQLSQDATTDRLLFNFSTQGQAWQALGSSVDGVVEAIIATTGRSADSIVDGFLRQIEAGESWKELLLRLDTEGSLSLASLVEQMRLLKEAAEEAGKAMRAIPLAVQIKAAESANLVGQLQSAQVDINEFQRQIAHAASIGAPVPARLTEGLAAAVNKLNSLSVVSRVNGGALAAGQAAIVGEQRPELFVPRTAGTIIPSLAGLGGGLTVVINNQGGVIGVDDLENRITRVVRDKALAGAFIGTPLVPNG